MKITHSRIITDGIEEEFISIEECPQIGYSSPVPLGKINLKTAHQLVKELSEKLSTIPY